MLPGTNICGNSGAQIRWQLFGDSPPECPAQARLDGFAGKVFSVYSSVSSVVFQMFACDDLDDHKLYLQADYTITCDSPKHRALQIYASLMIFLYPVGIPTLYAYLLFRHRRILQNERGREESLEVMPTLVLWKPYKPQHFYFEVVECGRRILLAGVVVFIYPNTAAQIAVTLALAVVAGFVSESIAPYQVPVQMGRVD